MNDYRKIAKFVNDNGIKVKPYECKGTGGGFDDESGLDLYKGSYRIARIPTAGYQTKAMDPVTVLRTLEDELKDLETIEVLDEGSLLDYLKKNHLKK